MLRGTPGDVQWNGPKVKKGIRAGMSLRVKLASQYLRDRTVVNLSTAVVKANGRVVQRSRPGEYPRAETTRLMKDIFYQMINDTEGVVGTTLDYGVQLEFRLDRSFLRRTLNEQLPAIRRILLSGPKLPGQQ